MIPSSFTVLIFSQHMKVPTGGGQRVSNSYSPRCKARTLTTSPLTPSRPRSQLLQSNEVHESSVIRWLDCSFNTWPFAALKICSITKIATIRSILCQLVNTQPPRTIIAKDLKFRQKGNNFVESGHTVHDLRLS